MTDYDLLAAQTSALIRGVPHLVADFANISALIYHSLDDINWAGFYLIEDGRLVLGPFQGNTACVEIPLGKGVCGTAAAEDRTVLVPDVHLFAGHIACDSASRSEIVIPVHINGRLIGVLDIDSPILSRFDDNDRIGLERTVRAAEAELALMQL
jgi:GAF domain-containing protein